MLSRISSFIFMLILSVTSFFEIPLYGYQSKQLINDSNFKNGFYVLSQQAENNTSVKLGEFVYSENEFSPSWMIAQWNSGPCLWADRTESGRYTITDGKTKWVTYNPDEDSVSMRLNAANVYDGEAAGNTAWPHLLLEQSPIVNYSALNDGEKAFYSCDSDRLVMSLDIKLSEFADTTNSVGINAVQYLAYFYMSAVDKSNFIWFGINLFDNRGYQDTYWAPDTVGGLMIYSISTKDTYGMKSKSLFRNGKPYVSDDWVHIEIDLTPHIDSVIKKANSSGVYSKELSADDFYISGTNIGFEIHGNYDCTVEIKDYSLTSYIKQ